MSNKDIRKLEGPCSFHLYIGFAPANKRIALNLCKRLQTQGVICCLRSTNDYIQESIQEGVKTSQKCLIFLTSEYLKDGWYQIETKAVIEKSRRFCRDVVVILKNTDLDIPERLREFETREFETREFEPQLLNDEKLAHFVDLVTREPNAQLALMPKQNIGYASAWSYFYGFLRIVLPGFKERLIKQTLSYYPDIAPKTVKKMLIIMPESCLCVASLNVPTKIEFTEKFVLSVAHRAGNQKRDYKSSLYKLIIDHETNEEYYFIGELATPLLTMYEMFYYQLCGMTQDQLYDERDAFYFTLRAILSHPDNAECNDQFKLLYWSDPETKKTNQLNIYDFLRGELRKEIMLQRQNEKNPSKIGTQYNINLSSPNLRPSLNSFETVATDGYNPARIYDDVSGYPMDRRPRGMCLIVNIANFDKGHRHLLPRRGAEKDEDLLKKLFERLHFEVQVHNDVTAQTLESLFLTMHLIDHSDYDAFVCCILSHGKLGVIYTSDGKPVEILKLVDYFTDKNCSTLKGKPKMFFIQACQKGDPEQENGAVANSLPRDGSRGDHSSSQNTASDSAANVENCETVEEAIPDIQEGISNITLTEVEPAIEEDARSAPSVSTLDESLPTTFVHKAVLVPGSPDFLMSYSTLPGSISYRDTHTGSLYIQSLCECLGTGMEIDRALKMVSSSVKEKLRQRGELDGRPELFQLPFHLTSGMDRLIYL